MYYILLDARKGGKMYSKLTGQVMTICKDHMAQKTLTEAAASYVYDGHGYTLMDHRQESFA